MSKRNIQSSDLPSSVVSVSSGTAPAINATTLTDNARMAYSAATGKFVFRTPFFIDVQNDFGVDFTGSTNSGTVANNFTYLQAAFALAQQLNVPMVFPIGLCNINCTTGDLFSIGVETRVTMLGGGSGSMSSSQPLSGTRLVRYSGTNALIRATGTGQTDQTRTYVTLRDLEFNGGSHQGDLAVFYRTTNFQATNVRFRNSTGRALRMIELNNSTLSDCYISTSGSSATSFTGCSWSSGSSQITMNGTIPPNCDNLPIYGVGIPWGTVISSVSGQVLTISQNTTASSSGVGATLIGAFPASSYEGDSAAGNFTGGSSVNHFTATEWEANNGPDFDIAADPSGTSLNSNIALFTGCKFERQVAANNGAVIRCRQGDEINFSNTRFDPGGYAAIATASTNGTTMTLSASNANIQVGQLIKGNGQPNNGIVKLKASFASGATVIQIENTIPGGGYGTPSSGISGNGYSVTGPGIPSGTTFTASTLTSPATITLSQATTSEEAGVDLIINGVFVTAYDGNVTVTTSASMGTNTSQSYVFGGSTARIFEVSSWGFSGGYSFTGCTFNHSGTPDYFFVQEAGSIIQTGCRYTATQPRAFWRVAPNIGADSVQWASNKWGNPTISIADERQAVTTSAAWQIRQVTPGHVTYGSGSSEATLGNTKVWQFAQSVQSSLETALRIPPDYGTGSDLRVRVTYSTPATGSANSISFQLAAQLAASGTNFATATPSTVTATGSPASAINGVTTVDLVMPAATLFTKANSFASLVSRLSTDSYANVVNILGVDLIYNRGGA